MNSFEKIGLIVLFFISLIYSYVKPTAIVENIQTKQNIVIYVEGEFEKKLSFKTKPTINDVLQNCKQITIINLMKIINLQMKVNFIYLMVKI